MEVWAPHPKSREAIKFWVDLLQGLAVFGGVAGAVFTYLYFKSTQRAEVQRPYYQKQLELYVEASRVTARIAQEVGEAQIGDEATSKIDPQTLSQFWELYYGPLVLVETRGEKSVAEAMNRFCTSVFDQHKCSRDPENKIAVTPRDNLAIRLSDTARQEIQKRW